MTSNYSAIKRYVGNEMNAAERQGFESEMLHDPFLSDAVDGFQNDPGALNDLPVLSQYNYLWVYGLIGAVLVVGLIFSYPSFENSPQPDKITDVRDRDFRPEAVASKAVPVMWDVSMPAPKLDRTAHPPEVNSEGNTRTHTTGVVYAPLEKLGVKWIERSIPEKSIEERSNVIYVNDLKLVKPDNPLNFNTRPDLFELTGHLPAKYESEDRFVKSTPDYGSDEPEYTQVWSEVFDAFHSGGYRSALSGIDQLEKTSFPNDVNIQFYRGLVLFHLSNYSDARRYFKRAERNINPSFRQEARWYRALCSESLGDTDESKGIFQEIAREGGHYSKRAVERLK